MDVSKAMLAKSDQLNAVDLAAGNQTVTILEVREGNADQPVNIITDVFGPSRPFKPSKTVIRILANAWKTPDTDQWVGHSMTLYREPTVKWAGEEIGGIRITALSHIDKPFKMSLATSKGKYAVSTVTPLKAATKPPAALSRDWPAEIALAGTDLAALKTLGNAAIAAKAEPSVIGLIRAAVQKAEEMQG